MDFTRYPDKSYQLNWLRYYLQCKAEQKGASANDVSDNDVEEYYVKTYKFSLVRIGIGFSNILLTFSTYLHLAPNVK